MVSFLVSNIIFISCSKHELNYLRKVQWMTMIVLQRETVDMYINNFVACVTWISRAEPLDTGENRSSALCEIFNLYLTAQFIANVGYMTIEQKAEFESSAHCAFIFSFAHVTIRSGVRCSELFTESKTGNFVWNHMAKSKHGGCGKNTFSIYC